MSRPPADPAPPAGELSPPGPAPPAGPLPLALAGCDFRVASSRWRSALVLQPAEVLGLSQKLQQGGWASSFVELSTCNRNEWIVVSPRPEWAAELLRCRMLARMQSRGLPPSHRIQPYTFAGDDAARHLLRVAIGQESLVVGERQIAGQLFRSLEAARRRGTSARLLNGLGSIAGRLVRIAQRRGCVDSSSRGVHSLAVQWLRHRLGARPDARVVVVGLGSIGRRVLGLLRAEGWARPSGCNRTVAPEHSETVFGLDALDGLLATADAVVVCSAAPSPLLDGALLARVQRTTPLPLLDLGIPHQVATEGLPPWARRAGLDELRRFHEGQQTPGTREARTEVATELVERALTELQGFRGEPTFAEVLLAVRRRQQELVETALPRLRAGRLAELEPELRAQIEDDMRCALQSYGHSILRSIRDATRHMATGEE